MRDRAVRQVADNVRPPQRRHLECALPPLGAMVVLARREPRAVFRLRLRQHREDAENDWHARVQVQPHDALRGRRSGTTRVAQCAARTRNGSGLAWGRAPAAPRVARIVQRHKRRTCVTASAMYSKCMVSPLIKQPTQMTASTRELSIKHLAPNGSSYEPGTCSGGVGWRSS